MTTKLRTLFLLLALAPPVSAQQATCWPTESTLKRYQEYFCAVDAPPGSAVTGRQLMTALAELEPVPGYMVANAGGDQNRGGIRQRAQRVEEYGLPIVSWATAADGIKIKESLLRTVVVASPVWVPLVRRWIFGAAPPEWTSPPTLAPESDIPLDSHGAASVTLYVRREAGVRRVSFGQAQPAPTVAPQPAPGFQPASWYLFSVETKRERLDTIAEWRGADANWQIAEKEMALEEAAASMNQAEVERLAVVRR